MRFDEYRRFDATGLARLVASRQVPPEELLETALARTARVNPALNAIVLDLSDGAREAIRAGLPAGPFAGVPFLIKDITVNVAGTVTAAGSAVMAQTPPATADSWIVRAYREAGLVIFGKTSTPEFGLAATTESRAFGITANPWARTLTAGGSSGGAAAAVSAGIVPAAHGSDGGGSLRIPASCCGLFGLKPSRGRVSLAPAGEGWGGLSVQHALTRSVRDSAALLDAVCRPQPGDPYWLDAPAVPFAAEVGRDPGRLRIAFSTGPLRPGELDPICREAVLDAAHLCATLGHDVEEARPDVDISVLCAAANLHVMVNVAATLEAEAERRGRPIADGELEALTAFLLEEGRKTRAIDVARASRTLHSLSRTFAQFFERYDVLLLATLGSPPVPVGYLSLDRDLTDYAERLYGFSPNTQPFNAGGQPAMSVPLAWTDDGLPVGVQFAARSGGESLLFRLAGQLETARPWFHRVPPDA